MKKEPQTKHVPSVLKILKSERDKLSDRDVWLNEQLDGLLSLVHDLGKLITENELDLVIANKIYDLAQEELDYTN